MMKRVLLTVFMLFAIIATAYASQEQDIALINAVRLGDKPKIESLLNEGADPNASTPQYSALHLSVFLPDTSITKLLIQKGADVNLKNNVGQTPLFFAVMGNNLDLTQFLLLNGADPAIKDATGFDAYTFAQTPQIKALLANAAPAAPAISNQNASYPELTGKTDLIFLDDIAMKAAAKEAPQLKEAHGWNNEVAYWLGQKGYNDFFDIKSRAPIRIQLLTPYSMMRYAYYKTQSQFKTPHQETINSILSYRQYAWVWVWTENNDYHLYNTTMGIENVVLRINGEIQQPVNRAISTPEYFVSAAKINKATLWAFPIEAFKKTNTPIEIVVVDSESNHKILKIDADEFEKLK